MSDFLHSFLSPFTSGMLTGSSQRRWDVDVDFFLMFSVVDENLSWYLDENIASFCTDPGSVDKEDEEFQESNKMHGQCHLCEATLSAETLRSVSAPESALRSCAEQIISQGQGNHSRKWKYCFDFIFGLSEHLYPLF